jgi:hypothetical protein
MHKDYNCSTRVVKSYSGFYDVLMNQRHLQPVSQARLIFFMSREFSAYALVPTR